MLKISLSHSLSPFYCSLTLSILFYNILIFQFLKFYKYKLLWVFFVCFFFCMFVVIYWAVGLAIWKLSSFSFNRFPYVFFFDNLPRAFYVDFQKPLLIGYILYWIGIPPFPPFFLDFHLFTFKTYFLEDLFLNVLPSSPSIDVNCCF